MRAKLEWGLSDDEAFANFKRMPESQLPDLLRTWQESAEGSLPRNPRASSASSTRTVKPSRQTSSETGSD